MNGYRDFAEEAVQRLTFIQAAKHLDLSLPEIADLLGVVEAQTCSQVRDTLRPKLDQRLQEVEQRLAALVQLRDRLTQARDRVGACPDSGRRCRSECAMTPTPRQCRHDHATTGNLP